MKEIFSVTQFHYLVMETGEETCLTYEQISGYSSQ